MTGSKRKGIVLQERDLRLLRELGTMRIIDREMTKKVAGFGSTTQVSLRLLELTRAGFLKKFFVGTVASGRKAIYTLSSKGAGVVGAQLGGIHRPFGRLVVGDAFVAHQMAINEIYLALKFRLGPNSPTRLLRWHTFRQPISDAIKLIPDAYLELAGDPIRACFLEVDLGNEALSILEAKASYYLQLALSGEFQQRFGQSQFRVLVAVNTERRAANIRAAVAKSTTKIFWFTTIENIQRAGFWAPIWLRPTGDSRQSLS